MRHLARITTSVLCATTLAACHHRNSTDSGDVMSRGDMNNGSTSASTSNGSSDMSTSSSSTYQDTTSHMSSGSTSMSSGSSMSGGMNGQGGMSRARGERGEIMTAMHSLARAKYALEHASHEYGGHRTGALKAVDGALVELHMASGQEGRPQTPRIERVEAQEIHKAIQDVERARRDMESAKHNFGGRKTETLKAVDAALSELKMAAEHEK